MQQKILRHAATNPRRELDCRVLSEKVRKPLTYSFFLASLCHVVCYSSAFYRTMVTWAPAQSREYASKRGLAGLLCGTDSAAARCLALREVVGEGLSLVDRLLLALGVVRVDDGRRRVAGGLAAAETLAAFRLHPRGRGRGSPAAAARALGEVVGEGLSLVDRRLLGLRVVRVDLSRRGVTSGLAAAEALSAVLHLRRHEAGRALRHPPSVRQRHRYVEEAPRRRVAFDEGEDRTASEEQSRDSRSDAHQGRIGSTKHLSQ